MRSELSISQIDSYGRDGFLVIDDFLTSAELEHLRAILTRVVQARDDARLPGEMAARPAGSDAGGLAPAAGRFRQAQPGLGTSAGPPHEPVANG
jgi:hypothetical protein